jgi:Holliday junction resolvase RusA-like endonuclease
MDWLGCGRIAVLLLLAQHAAAFVLCKHPAPCNGFARARLRALWDAADTGDGGGETKPRQPGHGESTTRRRTRSTALERDFVIVPKETGQALVFTVYGEPVPLPRHRLSRGRMFNPSATLQKDFAAACAAKLPLTPLEGAIEATLLFYFKRPKTHYGTGKNAQTMKPAAVAAGEWHSKKKDLDNLVKFVLDSLNGRAYVDDAQVGGCLGRH